MSVPVPSLSIREIINRAEYADRMMLQNSAPYVAYRYALTRKWITSSEHDAAKAYYGSMWNYCGD